MEKVTLKSSTLLDEEKEMTRIEERKKEKNKSNLLN